jgi:hypothetical protein
MALSPTRWLAWFAVGAAALTAGAIGVLAANVAEGERRQARIGPEWRPEWSGAVPVYQLERAVTALELRDSLVRALRQRPRIAGVEVRVDPTFPARLRAALDSTARAVWAEESRGAARAPVQLVALRLAVTRLPRTLVLEPGQTDGRTCVIVSVIGTGGVGPPEHTQAERYARSLRNDAGLCVFFAKYGVPGSGAHGWLRWVNYLQAHSARPIPELDPSALPFLENTRSLRSTQAVVRSSYYDVPPTTGALACIAGHSERCASAWEASRTSVSRDALLPTGFVPGRDFWSRRGPIGRESGHAVARLERNLGRERFERWWTADGTIDRAFEAAGTTLGAETARLLQESFGRINASPWPTAFEWLVYFVGIGGLAGITMLNARRGVRVR